MTSASWPQMSYHNYHMNITLIGPQSEDFSPVLAQSHLLPG